MKIHAPNITGSLVGNISGSATSTGSFGKLLGDGSGLSNLPASFTATSISGSWQGATTSTGSFGQVGIGMTAPAYKLDVGGDSDTDARIGRTVIGYGGFADFASFSHTDTTGTAAYALLQSAVGVTFLNSAAGRGIYFREQNVNKMSLISGSLIMDDGGNISGSASSTGSFGRLYVASPGNIGEVTIGEPAMAPIDIHGDDTEYKSLQFRNTTNDTRWQWSNRLGSQGSGFNMYHYNGSSWNEILTINTGSYDWNFPLANMKISGSASSTGSFGQIQIDRAEVGKHVAGQNGEIVLKAAASEASSIGFFENTTPAGVLLSYDGSTNVLSIYDSSTSGNRIASFFRTGDVTFDVANAKISGSATSTGSFGHIIKGGVNWDTAVSASAAAGGFGGGGGTITALNNATEHELVTIGATTTELDAESGLTYNGTELKILPTSGNNASIKMGGSDGTIDGYIYSSTATIGILDDDGQWAYKHITDTSHTWYINQSEKLVLTGNKISGSSTSTGSFGRLSLAGGITGASPSAILDLGSYYDNSGGPSISHISLYGTNYGFGISNNQLNYISNNKHAFWKSSDLSGTPQLFIDDTNISGSATSTGSFGALVISDKARFNGSILTGNSTDDASLELGSLGSGNRNVYIDFISDATYTDYGTRFIRFAGLNGVTRFDTRGTGGLEFQTTEAGYIRFSTTATPRMIILSTGNIGIGTISPANKLEVHGDFYATGSISGSATSTGSFGAGYFNGKVGLSRTAPTRKFHVYDGGVSNDARVYIEATSGSTGPGIEFAFDNTATQRGLLRLDQVGTAGTEFALYTRSTGGTLSNWLTFTSDEQVSGSATSTGSFGHIIKGGVNWDTAVSSSAATAGFGGGGGTITALNNATANELVTIGSTTTELDAESNLTFDGSTLTVTGDAKVTGDITIDDGGSLKEAGGTAAITFDGSGHVTKIGQASPSTDHVLTWDGSKWVASTVPDASVTGGTGLFGQGTTVGGVLFKTPGTLTGSFSDVITISSGSLLIDSGSAIFLNNILSGDGEEIDITTLTHVKGSKDAGYASSYGFDGGNSIASYLYSLQFTPDGKQMFVFDGYSTRTLYHFTLTTPWDIATQQYISKIVFPSSPESQILDLTWHPDGIKLYIAGTTMDGIAEFTLETPWDITTGSFSVPYAFGDFEGGTAETYPQGLEWKPDGKKLYVAGGTQDQIVQFKVTGSAFDIGSLEQEKTLDTGAETSPASLRFTKSGRQLFLVGTQEDSIIQYNLSSSWDIGTAARIAATSVNSQESFVRGLFIKPDNSRIWIAGSGGDEINEFTVTKSDPIKLFGDVLMEGYSLNLNQGTTTRITGSLDVDSRSDVKFNGPVQFPSSSLVAPSISQPLHISKATHVRGSKDLGYASGYGFPDANPSNYLYHISFSPDGKRMFAGDLYSTRTLYQFQLTTPWDIATQIYLGKYVIPNPPEYAILDLIWHPDGTSWYMCGTTMDGIVEFTVETPWDITSGSFGPPYAFGDFDGGVAATYPYGLEWKLDGTKFYMVDTTTDAVYQYAITGSAFDIGSMKYEKRMHVPFEETNPQMGITFRPDGSQFFLGGITKDEIYQYDLSKNWDISTAVWKEQLNISGQESSIKDMFLKPDNSGFFIVGNTADEVNEYHFPSYDTGSYLLGQTTSVLGDKVMMGANTDIRGDLDIYGKLTLHQPSIADFKSSVNFDYGLDSYSSSLSAPGISIPFNISKATHVRGSKESGYTGDYGFDGGLSMNNYLYHIHFSPDGKRMFAGDLLSTRTLYQFQLTTPWDIATQIYMNKIIYPSSPESGIRGITWHPDGTKIYITGTTTDGIVEYTFSKPWDITSGSFGPPFAFGDFDGGVATTMPGNCDWKPDGTKFYMVDTTTDAVYQYAITGSAFDIGSMKFEKRIFALAGNEYTMTAVRFRADGSQMFLTGKTSDAIFQYDLSKNWDIGTAVIKYEFDVSSKESGIQDIFLKPDNSGFFIVGDAGNSGGVGTKKEINEYKWTGGDSNNNSVSGSARVSIGNNTDVYGDLDVRGNLILSDPTIKTQTSQPLSIDYGISSLSGSIGVSNISNPIDITTATYKRSSADPGTITDITDIYFRPDGLSFYLGGSTSADRIYQFTLLTPWDLSSLNTAKIAEFNVSSTETSMAGMTFSLDGYWMFTVGGQVDGINSYNLSTPWDLSTAAAVKNIDLDNIDNFDSTESTPTGIDWKPDGTSVYVTGQTTDSILQYTVTGSAFDIGSMKFEKRIPFRVPDLAITSLRFRQDGSQFFLLGTQTDEINQFDLSIPWDIDTATFSGKFSVNSEESSPNGMFFKPDDSGFYVVGTTADTLFEYTLSDQTTARTFRDSRITGSAHTLDMAGQVNLFGSLDVLQDINVLGYIDGNIRGHRPIINQSPNFSCSIANNGHYFRVGGNVTCSIGTNANERVIVGTEYDFFQTSSAGNFLFQSGSGVSVNVKNNNMNLAGQFSSATLKKVAKDEWDLMGDLT